MRGGSDGSVVRMVKQFDAERKRLQAELQREQARLSFEAVHDALTGLPNRKLFFDRLSHALARSARHGFGTAVLFIDVDDFKSVNDTHGHLVGDQLLTAIARRLTERVRAMDTVARLGGDEFVVLYEDLVSPGDDTELLVERIESAFRSPFDARGPNARRDSEHRARDRDVAMRRGRSPHPRRPRDVPRQTGPAPPARGDRPPRSDDTDPRRIRLNRTYEGGIRSCELRVLGRVLLGRVGRNRLQGVHGCLDVADVEAAEKPGRRAGDVLP